MPARRKGGAHASLADPVNTGALTFRASPCAFPRSGHADGGRLDDKRAAPLEARLGARGSLASPAKGRAALVWKGTVRGSGAPGAGGGALR